MNVNESKKEEVIQRAAYFPYWEIRDDRMTLLRKSSQGELDGKQSLADFLEEFHNAPYLNYVFVRYGSSAQEAVQRTFWLKTKAGEQMEKESDTVIDPSLFFSNGNQVQQQYPQTIYLNGMGGIQKPNDQPPQQQNPLDMQTIVQMMESKMAEERANTRELLAEQRIQHLEELANARIQHSTEMANYRIQQAEAKEKEVKRMEAELKAKENDADAHPLREAAKGAMMGLAELGKNMVTRKDSPQALSGAGGATKKPDKPKATFRKKGEAKEEPKPEVEKPVMEENILAGLNPDELEKIKALLVIAKQEPEILDEWKEYAENVEEVDESEPPTTESE